MLRRMFLKLFGAIVVPAGAAAEAFGGENPKGLPVLQFSGGELVGQDELFRQVPWEIDRDIYLGMTIHTRYKRAWLNRADACITTYVPYPYEAYYGEVGVRQMIYQCLTSKGLECSLAGFITRTKDSVVEPFRRYKFNLTGEAVLHGQKLTVVTDTELRSCVPPT